VLGFLLGHGGEPVADLDRSAGSGGKPRRSTDLFGGNGSAHLAVHISIDGDSERWTFPRPIDQVFESGLGPPVG
jgi:hypothetical protein